MGNLTIEIIDFELPAKYEVCPRCEGRGVHVNPNIDGNGLSQECIEDSEFMEDYFNGAYDVSCYECNGERVVLVPDLERCSKEEIEEYSAQEKSVQDSYDTQEAERRMGA